MNQTLSLGSKIRRLRRQANLTQVALATRLGVSPSYLNLIESNRRALTRPLMTKLSEVLRTDPLEISGDEEARLHTDLSEAFGDPLFESAGPSAEDLWRLVGAQPHVARGILQIYRAYRSAREDALALGEQLADNPFLAAANHRLLTLLTSIRSFAEILRDHADLTENRRQQYIGTVAAESERLTDLVNDLFAFLGGAEFGAAPAGVAPGTEVADFFQVAGNYFADLEDAAERMRADLRLGGAKIDAALRTRLSKAHRIRVETRLDADGLGPGAAPALVDFDAAANRLRFADALPPSSRTFELARRLALAEAGAELDALSADAEVSPQALNLLRHSLGGYLAGAILMPYEPFLAAAQTTRNDIELLCGRFAVSFEQACRRLASLRRPGSEGVPFHFLRADIAGNITKRFTASGLRVPRYGGACPRWNLHTAFLTPGRIQVQIARLPDGTGFLFLARAEIRPGAGYHAPKRHYSVSIGCDLTFADGVVYADGLNLRGDKIATPVGVHCRLCPRQDCLDRVLPSIRH